MKVLITGFTPFGPVEVNPSQLIVEEMMKLPVEPEFSLHGHVLETSYDSTAAMIGSLLDELRPDIILLFGVAQKREKVTIERFALNVDDCSIPDNAGVVRTGQPITSDGPSTYESTLPVDDLARHLNENGIPAEASNHAGTFLCNHVFYRARHYLEMTQCRTPCGFIHVPMPVDLTAELPVTHSLQMDDLVRACELSLAFLMTQCGQS